MADVSAPKEGPREEQLEAAFDRIVEEGRPRLHRGWLDLLTTGTVAGLEVGLGVLALLVVLHTTHSELLAGLAFSVGFVALLLGHSELFTEGFLVPVAVVAAKEARMRDLLRLWVGTLVGNLVGGWVFTWFIVTGLPDLHDVVVETGAKYAHSAIDLRTLCLAILAGSAITLLTRMQNGTDSDGAKVAAAVMIGFTIAGLGLFHSVLDSLLVFAGIHAGGDYGYLDWLRWFGWAVFGNLLGGLGLTTLLRLLRSRRRLVEERRAGPTDKRGERGSEEPATADNPR